MENVKHYELDYFFHRDTSSHILSVTFKSEKCEIACLLRGLELCFPPFFFFTVERLSLKLTRVLRSTAVSKWKVAITAVRIIEPRIVNTVSRVPNKTNLEKKKKEFHGRHPSSILLQRKRVSLPFESRLFDRVHVSVSSWPGGRQ